MLNTVVAHVDLSALRANLATVGKLCPTSRVMAMLKADAYGRAGTPVLIKGVRVPLVGGVSMDSCGVDVTDCRSVSVGDEAVMWGPQLPPSEVAKHCDTVSYTLFAGLTSRVDREYINPSSLEASAKESHAQSP